MAKKKYSINWEDDLPVSFEVNGVQYESLDDVPSEADRRKLEAMLNSSFFDEEFDAEFDDPAFKELSRQTAQINGPAVERIILWIFTGVAALMLIIAGFSSWSAISKIGREESAPGVVVEMVKQREYINEQDRIVRDYYYPVVEFTARDGKRRTVQITEGNQTPQYEIGEEVTVLYNPEKPLDARIQSFGSSALMWILPGITGILGLAFLIAVIAVRKLMPTTG
ncbi:MAG: hypothetical protein DPW18_01790 [Chloroflexi bacterium]|nr:hypothetical protein [Chloroflexota bacterium]MDL1944479.1 DUF3592 domain-containing protein [Chloroflexi bacterium CFX2]